MSLHHCFLAGFEVGGAGGRVPWGFRSGPPPSLQPRDFSSPAQAGSSWREWGLLCWAGESRGAPSHTLCPGLRHSPPRRVGAGNRSGSTHVQMPQQALSFPEPPSPCSVSSPSSKGWPGTWSRTSTRGCHCSWGPREQMRPPGKPARNWPLVPLFTSILFVSEFEHLKNSAKNTLAGRKLKDPSCMLCPRGDSQKSRVPCEGTLTQDPGHWAPCSLS